MAPPNCSAPLSLIRRVTAVAQRRSRLPPARSTSSSMHSHATRQYSYSAVTSMQPSAIIGGSKNDIIFQQSNNIYPNHATTATHTAMGQARSMVMITQTKASDKDVEQNSNNNTTTKPDDAGDAPIEATYDENHIAISASCAARIKQLASTRPNPDSIYLRLYVDAGGCSGFQYKFLLLSEDNDGSNASGEDDEEDEDGTIDPDEDVVFLKDGMRVVIDQTSLDLLAGSTIDYVQEMIRSSFAVVNNPQSESACGCGSSFAVKNFEANPAMD